LEIGCGEGGNLLPFAEKECNVTGIDRSEERISQAISYFKLLGFNGRFIYSDFFDFSSEEDMNKYDIILIHDVIEHIDKCRKVEFILHAKEFLSETGIIFWGFPAWQMPFGGHQQICRNGFCSKMPFIHLLPLSVYNKILFIFGENDSCIKELLNIKAAGLSIEHFESIIKESNGRIVDRILWFINPHYKQKFKLKPRKLMPILSSIRYIRNYFSTSCFYITK
jgi:2-polyprenyl-3-methyl-5-hydroxy-6-metoxy-1,4-benzoquinol methylase